MVRKAFLALIVALVSSVSWSGVATADQTVPLPPGQVTTEGQVVTATCPGASGGQIVSASVSYYAKGDLLKATSPITYLQEGWPGEFYAVSAVTPKKATYVSFDLVCAPVSQFVYNSFFLRLPLEQQTFTCPEGYYLDRSQTIVQLYGDDTVIPAPEVIQEIQGVEIRHVSDTSVRVTNVRTDGNPAFGAIYTLCRPVLP